MHMTYPGGATASIYGTIANAQVPTWFKTDGSNSFCVRGWIRRGSGAGTAFRVVCIGPNLMHVQTSSGTGGSVRLYVHDDDTTAFCSATCEPDNEDWIFFAASYDASTHAMVVVARSENTAGGGTSDRAAGSTTFVPGSTTTRTYGDFTWGKNKVAGEGGGAGTTAAWNGDIAMLVVENDSKSQAELEALVDAAFTDLAGQTGKKNPIIPLMYTGTGFVGPVGGSKWFMPTGVAVQTPIGAVGSGARIGVTATSDNYIWWNGEISDGGGGFIAPATNADFEAVFSFYTAVTITGSPTFAFDEDFFGLVQPGITTNGNNAVASSMVARLRDRLVKVGAGIFRILWPGNSRSVRVLWYAGGPAVYGVWSANWPHAAVAYFLDLIGGIFNAAVQTDVVRRPFFDFDVVPSQTGTINSISSGTYVDFSRAYTNSVIEGSGGPGAGVRLGAGATLTQRFTPLAGSRLDGTTQVRHVAHLYAYPRAPDSVPWEIEDAAAVSGSGTDVASGTATGFDTEQADHTINTGAGDAYNAGTPSLTLGLSAGDQTLLDGLLDALAADDHRALVVYVVSGTGVGGLAQVVSITPGASAVLTLRHAFTVAVGNGSVLAFGYGYVKSIEATAPIPTLAKQGFRITDSGSGGTIWFATDVEAVGVDAYSFGTAGKGGDGSDKQIEDSFTNVLPGLGLALELDGVVSCPATQDGATLAGRQAYCRALGVPDRSILLVADPAHRVVDNTTTTWAEESLAQTDMPAIVGTELGLSIVASYNRGEKHNNTHPGMEQHYRMVEATFSVGDEIPYESSGGAGTGAGSWRPGRLDGALRSSGMMNAG